MLPRGPKTGLASLRCISEDVFVRLWGTQLCETYRIDLSQKHKSGFVTSPVGFIPKPDLWLCSISLLPLLTRIEAKHQELRDRQARDRFVSPDVEDDDVDPNYARITPFRGRPSPSQSPYGTRSPSPQRATQLTNHSREPSTEDPLDGLYAKINKPKGSTAPGADR